MVEKHYPPLYIRCYDCIADTAQRGHQPLLAFLEPLFHLVLVKGHLDAGIELAFFKGFEDVTERLGDLRAVERMVISIGREIHDGDVEPPPQLFGCLHPVHRALQADVHQYQIGAGFFRLLQGFFSR